MTLDEIWKAYGCRSCHHYQDHIACEAFPAPDRIPIEIASGQVDHFQTLGNDGGIVYAISLAYRPLLDTPSQTRAKTKILDHLRQIVGKLGIGTKERT